MAKHFGTGGSSKSPVHHYNLQHPTFSGGEIFFWGGTSNGDRILKPKTVRLDFPCFDAEDAETWCCCAEQFFEYYSTPDEHRLPLSSFHMDGRALVWFQELGASNSIRSLKDFVRSLQIRFGQGSYDDPMENTRISLTRWPLRCNTYRISTNSVVFWEALKTNSRCP
jgi:hypothetical protein